MNIQNPVGTCQNVTAAFEVYGVIFRQRFFLFVSRFSLEAVENRAKSVSKFLEDKQEKRRPPKADKEAHDMANKLRKVKKSIEKQKML